MLKRENPYPGLDKCNDCHDEVKAKDGSKECLMCHASDDNFPKRRDCGRCHEVYGPNFDANDVYGNGGQIARHSARQCAVCHKGPRPAWDNVNGRWVYPDGTPIK